MTLPVPPLRYGLALLAAVALAASPAARQAPSGIGSSWSCPNEIIFPGLIQKTVPHPTGGHTYVQTALTTVHQARMIASSLGGHLAVIGDLAENNFVRQNFTGDLWLGLSDLAVEGTWLCDSGEPFLYTNWAPSEPNDVKTYQVDGEDYVEMDPSGRWNDMGDKDPGGLNYGLVEIPATPFAQPISVSVGGVQLIEVCAGPHLAGSPYLVLGSSSGTSPGLVLDGHLLPLVPDTYFLQTLMAPNSPPLDNSFGLLDAQGHAQAVFSTPAGLNPNLVGQVLVHAALVLDLGGPGPVVGWTGPAHALAFSP